MTPSTKLVKKVCPIPLDRAGIPPRRGPEKGFSLLEILVIILMAGIFMGIMAPYLGTALRTSSLPISRFNTALDLQRAAENMTADFIGFETWQANHDFVANTIIVPSRAKRNGYLYKTTGGGRSGGSEPNWPTPAPADTASTFTDGTISWTECCAEVLDNRIKTRVANGEYGTYTVVSNKYVKWNTSTPPQLVDSSSGDPKVILEVRIRNPLGETVTVLFACRGGA